MINWLKQRLLRPQAGQVLPLASEQGFADFLAALPQSQPLACLAGFGEALGQLTHWSLDTEQRVALVTGIEEAAQPHLRQAWQMLFPGGDDARLDDRAAAALAAYYDSLVVETSGLATDLMADAAADAAGAALVAATLLHALGRRALLLRLNLRPVGAEYWAEVESAVRQVAALQVVQQPVWRGPLRGTTCGRMLVRLLAFEAGPLDTLRPAQVWAFYLVTCHLEQQISYTTAAPASHGYVVEMAQGRGPRRMRGEEPAAHARHLNLARAHASLVLMLVKAGAERAMPEWLAECGCDTRSYIRLLDTVIKAWSADPPRRRFERMHKEADLLVCNGFARTRRMIAATAFALLECERERRQHAGAGSRGLAGQRDPRRDAAAGAATSNAGVANGETTPIAGCGAPKTALEILDHLEACGDREMMDKWRIIDVSERGFGALPAAKCPWARVGAVFAFRQRDVPRWNIAIVRRLAAKAAGLGLIGAEVLRGEPVLARIAVLPPSGAAAPALTRDHAEEAMYIDSSPPCVLLPAEAYSPGATAMLFFDGASYALTLADSIEIGADYAACVVVAPPPDLSAVHHARIAPRSRFLAELLAGAAQGRARTGT